MNDKTFSLPEVESLEEVPDEYRPFYFEKEGKIQRQDPTAMVKTVAALRREKAGAEATAKDAQELLSRYTEVLGEDFDINTVKEWKQKAAMAEQLPTDQEVEKRISLVKQDALKQLQMKEKEIEAAHRTIEEVTVKGMLKDALRSADANQDGLDILPDIMRKRVKRTINDDGTVSLHPLDEDGTQMYADDGSEATLLDLANEIRAKRPVFFNGSKASGIGATGETVNLPKDAPNWYKMSPEQKTAFTKKHGKEAATALMMKSVRPAS